MLVSGQRLFADAVWAAHGIEIKTAIVALLVGILVGITGMGGGALMTPALIFLGVGHAASVVTAHLTAAAIYKTGGAVVHCREGSANVRVARLPICRSVPVAFLRPHRVPY